MCNRARASLKALQLLGNSVRGLDQASWRLAYNAVCLPVLTYGCQLWYTGKQKGLVKKLQTVQNEAVRIISGTFRTTPREPLHQLLSVLPMNFRLDLLTKNTALMLYKVPNDSQLRRRLGDLWYEPEPAELPLPTPNNARANTTLRSLASKAVPQRPRVDPFPELPEDAPRWKDRVRLTPKPDNAVLKTVVEDFDRECRAGVTTNIFCGGVVSNKDREDAKQLGATAAVLYHQGREVGHRE